MRKAPAKTLEIVLVSLLCAPVLARAQAPTQAQATTTATLEEP